MVLLVASILVPSVQKTETIQVTMRDAVLHETNRISLFGIKDVNPALISAMVVSGILLVFAVIVRIFVIPRFKMVPGKFQMLLEQAVDLFDGMAKSNSPGRSGFLGAYIFTAGAYIFIGTLFELFGIQAITTEGSPITLPAPLSDVNAALVTELVYYNISLSFVLPVFVGIMFTLLHALIQAYVLTMLVALYFGEVSEKQEPKKKKVKAEAEN